ncbi:ABC transporter substrate-binding protein [Ramlibacter tataouinensis]|uniref:ABC transporter substrate-binding protein n=1 Tax=Ramlibacter tataouinensis TaxID=94132 RepID=UPI001D12A7EF|nr:ABC transporter substrate-binding protein [Ramlibacter tataouinensis]
MRSRPINRRQMLAAAATLAAPAWALAQSGKASARGITIAQIVDTSPAQQDVSKDFLIGSRAAWQDVNARGGLRGRTVQHATIEVDGTAASVRAALASVRDNPDCLLLCGSAGDVAATRVATALRAERLGIAHVAPWLQNSGLELDDQTFPIFAPRQEQIAHALKSLSVVNVRELGVVYAGEQEYAGHRNELEHAAAALGLKIVAYRGSNLAQLGQQLTQASPAILLFVGGTPELVQFTQGLERQSRQRYVVALADVNLQTLQQMGAARHTPVIATQSVPMVTASHPIVRKYREVLARLFDEPPAPLSLAGFIAARYAFEVLGGVDGQLSRASVLAAFQRRETLDVGGFRVSYDGRRRGGTFVTQSMLTTDGRVIG